MNNDILLRYDAAVPRYTSYPTAPHFSPQLGAGDYATWLAALDPAAPLSLYAHVPFCDTLCWFCGCNTRVVNAHEPVARYVALLRDEIALVAENLRGRHTVRHIHFGGGSPTMMGASEWVGVMGDIRARFDLAEDAEIAVEIDPRGFGDDQIDLLATIGVNRISLGVQDLNPAVQRSVNRIQPFETTERVVRGFRAAGVGGINIDLMYGLPGQTEHSVTDTVTQILQLAPDRLALFGYAHVPWMKSHQRLIDEDALPDAAERLRQFEAAAACLRQGGYTWIGLDHFARDHDALTSALREGRLRRNFQGYTTDDTPAMIGFGASAIGMLPEGYVQNITKTSDYAKAINAGSLPIARGIALSDDDRMRRAIIEQLMCYLAADTEKIAAQFDEPTPSTDALAPMVQDGLVNVKDGHVEIKPEGRLAMRAVCAAFDSYLTPERERHSRAL